MDSYRNWTGSKHVACNRKRTLLRKCKYSNSHALKLCIGPDTSTDDARRAYDLGSNVYYCTLGYILVACIK